MSIEFISILTQSGGQGGTAIDVEKVIPPGAQLNSGSLIIKICNENKT